MNSFHGIIKLLDYNASLYWENVLRLSFVMLYPKLIYVDYFHIHPLMYLDSGG